jgi:hypothetical protein
MWALKRLINSGCRDLTLETCLGDGSTASSLGGSSVDRSPVSLGSTAIHDPALIASEVWARWKSLDKTLGANGFVKKLGVVTLNSMMNLPKAE